MSLLGKMWTAVRGKANEAGEAFVDANALTILDQEIRDSDQALAQARDSVSEVAAKRSIAEKELAAITADIDKYTEQARACLAKGEEDLARQCAERVIELQGSAERKEASVNNLKATETQLRANVLKIDDRIKKLKSEVETVRANEAVLKAQASISKSQSGMSSRLGNAADSLQRIKERQEMARLKMEEADKLDRASTGADLDDMLAKAGISKSGKSADDLLSSLKGNA